MLVWEGLCWRTDLIILSIYTFSDIWITFCSFPRFNYIPHPSISLSFSLSKFSATCPLLFDAGVCRIMNAKRTKLRSKSRRHHHYNTLHRLVIQSQVGTTCVPFGCGMDLVSALFIVCRREGSTALSHTCLNCLFYLE